MSRNTTNQSSQPVFFHSDCWFLNRALSDTLQPKTEPPGNGAKNPLRFAEVPLIHTRMSSNTPHSNVLSCDDVDYETAGRHGTPVQAARRDARQDEALDADSGRAATGPTEPHSGVDLPAVYVLERRHFEEALLSQAALCQGGLTHGLTLWIDEVTVGIGSRCTRSVAQRNSVLTVCLGYSCGDTQKDPSSARAHLRRCWARSCSRSRIMSRIWSTSFARSPHTISR